MRSKEITKGKAYLNTQRFVRYVIDVDAINRTVTFVEGSKDEGQPRKTIRRSSFATWAEKEEVR